MSRLGIRRRLLLTVVAAVALALAVMIVGFNVLLAHNLSRDANDLARSRAAAGLAQLKVSDGRLVVGETPDDAAPASEVWVFDGHRALEEPRVGESVSAAARGLAGGPAHFVDVASADTRLYAQPVVVGGRRVGTVVAGVSLAPYEQTRNTALVGSLILGFAVLLLAALAARWLLASSLRPVARMTRQASEWSEHDLDRRFGLGDPHDELSELAATLDGLLDRLSASMRREQRFSAELSHELRTPLARVLAETELALSRPRSSTEYREALETVRQNAQQLSRTVDALVTAARHETAAVRGTADAFAVASAAKDACSTADRDIEIDRPNQPMRLGVDAELAERILQPLVENACRYGRHTIRLSVQRGRDGIRYAVEDDGPGIAEDERERIFEPGFRGRAAARNGAGGAGLGLALARRLARSVDGDVEAVASEKGGRFIVRLPAG
jgi:signal transduction histidine kinase